jgi:hypothetical protein
LPVSPVVTFEPQPTVEESHHLWQQAVRYVQQYTTTLVDFTCTVTTQTYTKEPSQSRPLSDTSIVITSPSDWHAGRFITQEVSYYQGREYTSGHAGTKGRNMPGLTPGASWTNGEFAQALRITFAPASQAHFEWSHWEWQADHRLAVFSYAVAREHSQFVIDTQVFRSGIWQNASLTSAYQGHVYLDPESGSIYRLLVHTSGIPPDYAIDQGRTVLDYGPVVIAGRTYFLLTQATSYLQTKQYEALFRKTFTHYRKFEAESKIVGVKTQH